MGRKIDKSAKLLFFTAILSLLISCTKSGALTGGSTSGGSSNGGLNGSITGGLSPISGATISLFMAGTATPIATATTNSTGAFSLNYTNPGSGLLYATAAGGNAGNGTNAKISMMAIVGSAASVPSSLLINEGTTAATSLVTYEMRIFNDTNGSVTLNAPSSTIALNNIITQYNNLITNSGTTTINSSNANVSTSITNSVYTTANALASCIENASACSTLFNAAQSTTGAAALNLMDAINNMINNSSNVASPVYTLAFPLSSTTGFPLSSSSLPSGFTFYNALPAATRSISVGNRPVGVAIDASGNVWVANFNDNTVSKISGSSGGILGTFSVQTGPSNLAIDANGNVWVVGQGASLRQLSPAGTTLVNIAGGSFTANSACVNIDPSGNVWATTSSGTNGPKKYSSSGTLLLDLSSSITFTPFMIFDKSGNFWISVFSGLEYFNTSGTSLTGIFQQSSLGGEMAIDPSGNLWFSSNNNIASGVVSVGNPSNPQRLFGFGLSSTFLAAGGFAIDANGNAWQSGRNTATTVVFVDFAQSAANGNTQIISSYPNVGNQGIAIDPSGNVWVANTRTNAVVEIIGVSPVGQFFPYSGPQFPNGNAGFSTF